MILCLTKNNERPSFKSDCVQYFNLSSEYQLNSTFQSSIHIEIPQKTKKNGTLNGFIILTKKSSNNDDFSFKNSVVKNIRFSKYRLKDSDKFVNLLSSTIASNDTYKKDTSPPKPITHLLSKLNIYGMYSQIRLKSTEIPGELYSDLQILKQNIYLPIIYVDKMSMNDDDFKEINAQESLHNFTINYGTISIGALRFYKQLQASIDSLKEMGFSDHQVNELTSLFTDTNVYLILVTFAVSLLHVRKYSTINSPIFKHFLNILSYFLNFLHLKMTLVFGEIRKIMLVYP